MGRPIVVQGMQGLGDNIHQRALIRQLLAAGREIWLETPWPCIYHDMPELNLVRSRTTLRTQIKNMEREARRYSPRPIPAGAERLRVWYSPDGVRSAGSILGAMLIESGFNPAVADFRLPLPPAWLASARATIVTPRPILIYRPLVERTEWRSCAVRNPDHAAYAAIFAAIRDRFFVISIADLDPGKEWMVGRPVAADMEFHRGELRFETLAGLTAMATLVYCSPGFATLLAQALGTPLIAVFGGHENSSTISAGAKLSPTLAIDPVHSCLCFRDRHHCDKTIDLPAAHRRAREFADAALDRAERDRRLPD